MVIPDAAVVVPPVPPVAEDENGDHFHAQALPTVHAFPWRHTKVIHFIRHGEGYHNVAGRQDNHNYLSPDYFDAHLTELGWRQAYALRDHIQSMPEPLGVEAVIVSPLSRALETAVGIFGGNELRSGEEGEPLMMALESEPGRQAPHAAVSATGCPPFIAWEECREHLGRHPCDQRRALSHYRARFPAVDFSLVNSEKDELWTPGTREGHAEIRERGAAFLRWLMARPEPRLAVVSHSSFLFFMLSTVGAQCDTRVKGELHRWRALLCTARVHHQRQMYENCEMRTVVLADASGASAGLDPNWFPGGHHLSRATFETSSETS